MKPGLSALAGLIWLALAGLSVWAVFQTQPAMGPIGALLAATAPLIFLLGLLLGKRTAYRGSDAHPVLVAAFSGLGAVISMVAVTRFGEVHERYVTWSALSLLVWLVWVRLVWRKLPRDPGQP